MSINSPRTWSFGVQTILLLVALQSCFVCYLFSHLNLAQGAAVERLSKKGWIFSHLPPSEATFTQSVLSKLVPEHYVQPIMGARPPLHFSSRDIKDSENDLNLIKSFEILVFIGGSIGTADIDTIGKLNIVDELRFEYCNFESSDTQIGEALEKLHHLQKVHLINRGTNCAVVKGLAKIPRIREISLGNLTATELSLLIELPSLERLSLNANLAEITESVRGKAKIIFARTIRERTKMAGRPYQGSILTLRRPNLTDIVVEY